jgi:hypothetical protein
MVEAAGEAPMNPVRAKYFTEDKICQFPGRELEL